MKRSRQLVAAYAGIYLHIADAGAVHPGFADAMVLQVGLFAIGMMVLSLQLTDAVDHLARIYFSEFADSALVLSVTYWYHPPDWWEYNEFSQRLNLQILEAFHDAQIEFAFPTQTVHLVREE